MADERDEFCSDVASVAFCLEMGMEVVAKDAGWIVGLIRKLGLLS